ncbi:MAG: hypothetical protein ACLUGP_07990 [Faecalibacterium prausnitzii]
MAEPVALTRLQSHDSTYQPVQMTTEPAQEPEPVEEEDENEKIEAALLEQGYLHEEIPLDFDLQCHLITVCEEYGVPQSVALASFRPELVHGHGLERKLLRLYADQQHQFRMAV